MLTYTSPDRCRLVEPVRESVFLLMLLVFAWLWPGVFSHGLWNPAEPQVYSVIEQSNFSWTPTLFGKPYFRVAPIYVKVASISKQWLSPWAVDDYAATRFASVFFTVIGLLSSGMAAYRLFGRYQGRSTVLILIGSVGLLGMGHFLGGMSVVFAGVGLCIWGLSLIPKQVVMASVWIGVGILFLGQAQGWLVASAVPLIMIILLFFDLWNKIRVFTACLGALVIVIPLLSAQLLILAKVNQNFFHQYIDYHIFGEFGGLKKIYIGFNFLYYFQHLLWFAFPAWALAGWTAVRVKLWRQGQGAILLIWLMVFTLLLVFNPHGFQDNLIYLLVPLAILGSVQLDYLRRGVAAFLNWFGMMAFGTAAIFLWLGFFAMNYGVPAKLAQRAMYFSPYYVRDIDVMPMLVALLFTPIWLFAITRKRIRGRQAVSNWAAGITLIWALLMTLFLPWLDAAKSYRPIVRQMENMLSDDQKQKIKQGIECIYLNPQFIDARIAWQQYSDLPMQNNQHNCLYHLIEFNPKNNDKIDEHILWQGKRPRNKNEAFALIITQNH